MHICLVTPAAKGTRTGNRFTALAWARVLRTLGHRVQVTERHAGEVCDLLIALHARRSHASVVAYRRAQPRGLLVVVLTGTDLYADLPDDPAAQESLRLADRLVVLQDRAVQALPAAARHKAQVIVQSVPARPRLTPRSRTFDVAVVGHLRDVKVPFLAAEASRPLPASSRVRILHAGGALEPALARHARREMATNPRYRWLGELPRWRARNLIARSRVLALTSRSEGGAHVVGEAAVCGVPVLSTAIDGTIGLLGEDYPGYFPPGDAQALTALLERAEQEPRFLESLERAVRRAAPRFHPRREREAWRHLLASLGGRVVRD